MILGVTAISILFVWFLVLFDSTFGQPALTSSSPSHVVPPADPATFEGRKSIEAFSSLAEFHIRILSMVHKSVEDRHSGDPAEVDVLHFVATAYTEMNVAYSVLLLERDLQDHRTLNKSKYVHRYIKNSEKQVAQHSKPCSALVVLSDTSFMSLFLIKLIEMLLPHTETMWERGQERSTALLYVDTRRDASFSTRLQLQFNIQLNPKNPLSFRWKVLCSLGNWRDFECISAEANKKGDLKGGAVLWSQLAQAMFPIENVLLNDALPVVCGKLNATLLARAKANLEAVLTGGGIAGDLWDTSSYGHSIYVNGSSAGHLLKWSETYHGVSFIFIGDAVNRKLGALTAPMDGATWIWTTLSALAVSALSAALVEGVALRDSLFNILSGLLCQGRVEGKRGKWQFQSVLALWLLATIVVVGGYTGLLFSALTSPVPPWAPRTLRELTNVYEGDIISNAKWKADISLYSAFQGQTPPEFEILQTAVSLFEVEIEQALFSGSGEEKAWVEEQGGEKLRLRLKYLHNDLTDLTEAQVDRRAKALNFVDLRFGYMQDKWMASGGKEGGAAYWLPESYAYVGQAMELRLFQLMLQTLGVRKIVLRAEEPISFLSNVGRWTAVPSNGVDEIQGKLGQLVQGGFMSLWRKNATSWEAIQQLKSLQSALRLKSVPSDSDNIQHQRLSLLLNNFITKRNLMVHLFNDFASSTSVNLQTVDWSVRRLSFTVLQYVFNLCSWLSLGCGTVLMVEFLVASLVII